MSSELAAKKPHWIDFDTGRLIYYISMESILTEFVDVIVAIANGKQSRNERRFKLQLALYSLIIGLHFFYWVRTPRHERRAEYAVHVGFHPCPKPLGNVSFHRPDAEDGVTESPLCRRTAAD